MSTPLVFPPCKICSGVATGIHYGVNTCEKCKAFFRRAITEKNKYKCTEGNDCQIVDRKRGNCSACRLQKCINEGMSKDAVKHGRYTVEQRTKTILEVQNLKRKTSPKPSESESEPSSVETADSVSNDSLSPGKKQKLIKRNGDSETEKEDELDGDSTTESSSKESTICEEEIISIIQTLIAAQNEIYPNLSTYFDKEFNEKRQREFYEKYKLRKDTFNLKPVSSEDHKIIFEMTGIDIDDRYDMMKKTLDHSERGIVKYITFAKVIPGFLSLHHEDKMNLITASRFEYWYLGHYLHTNLDLGVMVGYDIQHSKDDSIKFYGSTEWSDEMDKFTHTIQKLDISYEEIALLRAIVVLFRDRCKLKEPEKVEDLQWKLIQCLKYLINARKEKASFNRFSKYMDRLMALRYLTEKNKTVLEKFAKSQEDLLKKFPLFNEYVNARVKQCT